MQTQNNSLYQCITCYKRFQCKPSFDRHVISHDLEVFASWTKPEPTNCNTSITPIVHHPPVHHPPVHIPPHRKLVQESMDSGTINQAPVFVKTEGQQPQACSYHHQQQSLMQYETDLILQRKQPTADQTHQSIVDMADTQVEKERVAHPSDSDRRENLAEGDSTSKKGNSRSKQYSSSGEVKEKSFFCDECSRSYKRRDHLNRHKLVHTGARPFVCMICSKSFIRKDKLQRHEKIHMKDRQFDCQICNKSFGRKDGLNKHYLAHKMGTINEKSKKHLERDLTNSE